MISFPNNLEKELDHLRKVFHEKNNYPRQITNRIIDEEVEREQSNLQRQSDNKDDDKDETERVQLILPYGG